MKHTVLCRLALLLAVASTMIAPPRAGAIDEGPATPGGTAHATIRTAPDGAAPKSSKRDTYPFRGTVGAVDVAAMTLVLEGKQAKRIVQLKPDTRFEKDGVPATAEAVKAGDVVGGTLRRSSAGHEEALLVRIGPKSDETATGGGAKPKRSPKKAGTG